MELKVWVEGIPRIVCGIGAATTCHDVVLALAAALGRTGRFTLVQRWRDTEHLLAPDAALLPALQQWAEYANDVQVILQYAGAAVTPGCTGSGRWPAAHKRVRRNLTFSGASSSTSSLSRQPVRSTPSHDNSSLESLEEQSSFTSHSSTSTSPYASLDHSSSGGGGGTVAYGSLGRTRVPYNLTSDDKDINEVDYRKHVNNKTTTVKDAGNREELLKLVKLQIDRLKQQQAQQAALEAGMCGCTLI